MSVDMFHALHSSPVLDWGKQLSRIATRRGLTSETLSQLEPIGFSWSNRLLHRYATDHQAHFTHIWSWRSLSLEPSIRISCEAPVFNDEQCLWVLHLQTHCLRVASASVKVCKDNEDMNLWMFGRSICSGARACGISQGGTSYSGPEE